MTEGGTGNLPQERFLHFAYRLLHRAAGMKTATFRRVERGGDVALEDNSADFMFRVK